MNGTSQGMSWGARLLVGFALLFVGAGTAIWALARYQSAARVLGVVPAQVAAPAQPAVAAEQLARGPRTLAPQRSADVDRIARLEQRLTELEGAAQRAEGSVGRADALLVAFAARRAIDRGVSLGYLEKLLVGRFGHNHPNAVTTIVTASHQPVRLNELIAEFDALAPDLRRVGGNDWWANLRNELGSLVQVHRADRPVVTPDVRYQRARQRLQTGDVDRALAETMRLPGATRAEEWIGKARRYIAVHRALDEIETAALLGTPAPTS